MLFAAAACTGSEDDGTDTPPEQPPPTATMPSPMPTVAPTPTQVPRGTTCPSTPPFSGPTGRPDAKLGVGVGDDYFCIAWRDTYTDERGFRVVITYSPSRETFEYTVAANVNEVYLPPNHLPDRGVDLASRRRKDFQIMVYALLPTGEVLVDGFALQLM